MYIIYILIITLHICLVFLVKDKTKLFKQLGIISLIYSILLICIGLILFILSSSLLSSINFIKVSSLIFTKFFYNSISLLILGLIEMLMSKMINNKTVINKHKTNLK